MRVSVIALLVLLAAGCSGEKPRELEIQMGDLVQPRGRQLNYVRGNVYEAKNTIIDVLEGNVIGSFTATGLVPKFQERLHRHGIEIDLAVYRPNSNAYR